MKTTLSKRDSSLILLINIFMHAIFFIALFMISLPKYETAKNSFLIVELEDKTAPNTSMDFTAMQPSAPITPKPQKSIPATTPPITPPPAPLNMFPAMNAASQQKKPVAKPTPLPATIENEEKIMEKNKESKNTETHENLTETVVDETIALATQFLEFIAPKKPKEPITKNETPSEKNIDQSPNKNISSSNHSAIEHKKTLPSLAQLTESFMEHMQQDNVSDDYNSPMAVKSNKRGKASMEQIQHLNYCHKIIGCLITSYRISKGSAPKEQPTRACVQIALNQDGSIHTLKLLQSSGNINLDHFIMDMFKDASSSFPPVPSSFKQIPYSLPIFNIDSIQSFQSSQGWYIDNHTS